MPASSTTGRRRRHGEPQRTLGEVRHPAVFGLVAGEPGPPLLELQVRTEVVGSISPRRLGRAVGLLVLRRRHGSVRDRMDRRVSRDVDGVPGVHGLYWRQHLLVERVVEPGSPTWGRDMDGSRRIATS